MGCPENIKVDGFVGDERGLDFFGGETPLMKPLRQYQIRFCFVGKEVSDMSGSGE